MGGNGLRGAGDGDGWGRFNGSLERGGAKFQGPCIHPCIYPPEPAIRMADIRDVTDGIRKLRKACN